MCCLHSSDSLLHALNMEAVKSVESLTDFSELSILFFDRTVWFLRPASLLH